MKQIIGIVLLGAALALSSCERIDKTEQEIAQLRERLKELNEELRILKNDQRGLEVSIEQQNAKMIEFVAKMKPKEAEIVKIGAQLDLAHAALTKAKNAYANILAKIASLEYLIEKALVFVDIPEYYEEYTQLLQGYYTELASLQEEKEQIEQQIDELVKAIEEINQELIEKKAAYNEEYQKEIEKINAEIKKLEEVLNEMLKKQEEIEKEIEAIKAKIMDLRGWLEEEE